MPRRIRLIAGFAPRWAASFLIAVLATLSAPAAGEADGVNGVWVGTAAPLTSGVPPGFFTSYTLHGGHVAAGVAWRNKGAGQVTIAGIPAGATVEAAFLYWATLNPGITPAMAQGRINGTAIIGHGVASCRGPCWGTANAAHTYRADVTDHVTGNAVYTLAGFASGLTTGESAFSGNVVAPLAEGATLVVVYRLQSAPVRTIVLSEGCLFFAGSGSFTFNLSGFVANPVKSATITVFGADGQAQAGAGLPTGDVDKEVLTFNGATIAGPAPSPWNGSDGDAQLWDTRTYTVTTRVPRHSTRVTVASPGYSPASARGTTRYVDCVVLVGAVFSVTARDTDGDGLVNAWERHGYDHDGDGVVDVDLPAMGANVLRKDIFVEIDYMVGSAHTHKPKANAVAIVVEAMRNAPVANPDGTTGITLHVDTGNLGGGNAVAHDAELGMWHEFDAIKAANFARARAPIFHYVLFVHDMAGLGTTSGLSRGIPGRDLAVALGGWTNQVGTTQEQGGTLMHELGHNIGLRHGGIDGINYKPNFLSVMNYAFQTRGLIKDGTEGHFDYSRFVNRTLREAALNERVGIRVSGNPTNYGTRYHDATCTVHATTVTAPIDWNGNTTIDADTVTANVNSCTPGTVLVGHDDWANVILDGRSLGQSNPNAFLGHAEAEEGVAGPHPLAELDRETDSRLAPVSPARLSIASNARGAGLDDVTWRPVGLEIITHYNIYVDGKDSLRLVDTVPADAGMELHLRGEYRWTGVLGRVYAVTAVDHYGNESALTVGITGR
jgi:hypothetical protein